MDKKIPDRISKIWSGIFLCKTTCISTLKTAISTARRILCNLGCINARGFIIMDKEEIDIEALHSFYKGRL